jgi:predicted nucleic acid-binding protein
MEDAIAIDAEPLIAYYWDEPGADTVEETLDDVERGHVRGWINTITCTEVRHVCGRDDQEKSRQYVNRIRDWFNIATAEDVWERAATYKQEYPVALGNAFTFATAGDVNATLLVGGDDDYDDVSDVPIERFRDGSA